MRIKTAKCLGTLQAIFLLLICTTAFAQVSWTKLPGAAMDIGAGPDGSVWVIGANAVLGGYDIYRWDGTNWQRVPGGATRIAVGPNGPWIINSSHNIFRWTGSGWQMTPGAAQDIGVGADGTAWVIGMDDASYRWDGSNWSSIGGGAIQIAVDPKGDPWVVNRGDQIYHHSAAGWELLPGAAKDITVGADGVVYVIGTGPTTGGFKVYDRASGDWKEEPGIGGVRIAAGPAGKVYVVQDAASGNAIMSRLAAPSMPTTISGTITTSIPVTQNPQVVPGGAATTSTSGSLVVGTGQVPTTNTTPIVVQSYTSYPPPNLNLAKGSIICPIIEAGPKLTKGCLFVGQPAIFLATAPSNDCASGSFFDPENGGECWSCPSGFIRNVSPVTAKDACWKAVSEDLKSATNVGSTGCSSGSFSDPRNGGECWSCPSGYMRTLTAVTDSRACAKDLIVGPWSAATYIKKPGSCTGDSFFDPIDGGSCWTCPSGYRRTANPVNGTAACAQTISTQYSAATLVSGCAQYASFAYGTPFRDPRGGGQCWACPNQLKRSAAEVNSTATGNAAACVVGSDTEDVFWQSPQFPEPGMFPFMDNLVTLAFKDPKRVDAFIQKRANGDPQKRRDLWEKMRSAPHDSPEYKALLFAALVTAANQGSTAPGFLSVGAFENYIRTRRTFVANDANDMYQAWKGVNSYNQYQAAKTASGISGMDTAVLGGIPSDYASLAWLAASPDQRGGAFMEAVDALGGYGASGVLGPDPSTPDGGFNSVYLQPVYKVIDKGLDKYKDWAVDTVSWGRISGKAFETAGKVVELGMIAVEKAVDLSIAITTIVNQEQAEHTYAQLVTDAQQPVSIHQMLTSGNDADLQQVMLYWALASSPYSSGPKAGTGQLTDAQMCADQMLALKCKYSYGVVTDAANAVQVWPAPAAAPAAKPTIPESWEEARVTSIDTANSALHARMVDFGKAVIIPVGDPLLHSVTVGSIIYLNPGTHEASLDGKTACCRFTFDTGGKTLPN